MKSAQLGLAVCSPVRRPLVFTGLTVTFFFRSVWIICPTSWEGLAERPLFTYREAVWLACLRGRRGRVVCSLCRGRYTQSCLQPKNPDAAGFFKNDNSNLEQKAGLLFVSRRDQTGPYLCMSTWLGSLFWMLHFYYLNSARPVFLISSPGGITVVDVRSSSPAGSGPPFMKCSSWLSGTCTLN